MFTDSHTHLYLPDFKPDLNTVIKNALKKKVNRFLLPNINNDSLPQLLSICQQYNNVCFPMIGLHPCSITKNYTEELDKLYANISKNKFIAIGEVGIDLYWERKFFEEQKSAFQIQIEWGTKHNLPIVIHSRNSFNETYEILRKNKKDKTTGIFHCFSDSYKNAKKIIELGFYLGIGGVLTFKNSNLEDVIKKIDLKHIVLETDSPYLAPHPMRGKRNEPQFLSVIAEKICAIKNCSLEELSLITNENIKKIFFSKKLADY